LDSLPVTALQRYERELYAFLEAKHADVLKLLREKKELTDDVKTKLDAALADFGKLFRP
jgi:F-type H+-transporting ATPase subunit alpha